MSKILPGCGGEKQKQLTPFTTHNLRFGQYLCSHGIKSGQSFVYSQKPVLDRAHIQIKRIKSLEVILVSSLQITSAQQFYYTFSLSDHQCKGFPVSLS